MGEHVHVRVRHDVDVTDDGALVEVHRCRCGASWRRTYRTGGPEPE